MYVDYVRWIVIVLLADCIVASLCMYMCVSRMQWQQQQPDAREHTRFSLSGLIRDLVMKRRSGHFLSLSLFCAHLFYLFLGFWKYHAAERKVMTSAFLDGIADDRSIFYHLRRRGGGGGDVTCYLRTCGWRMLILPTARARALVLTLQVWKETGRYDWRWYMIYGNVDGGCVYVVLWWCSILLNQMLSSRSKQICHNVCNVWYVWHGMA